MATNKGKTTAAKPRRFGVGMVLSCVRRLRRRQPKAPPVLERSLATTVRRGSGRKTVPLDLELVDMASTSLVGGGEIKEVDSGAGEEDISLIAEDSSANRDELRSISKLPTDSKQETPEITPTPAQDLDRESITEKLAGSAAKEDQLFDNNDTSKQENDQNIRDTEDLAGNTKVENASNVSGDQHISLDQSKKEEIDKITQDLSEKSETQMDSDDPTIEISTSSYTRDLDAFPLHHSPAQLIPLLDSSLPNETTDQATEDLEETINQTAVDWAVNTKHEQSSPISSDYQEADEKPTKQYSDYWEQDVDAGRTRTTGGVNSKLVRSSSAPSPSLPDLPTMKTYPAFSSPQQSDENLLATNTVRKEPDNPALPLKAEQVLSLPTSSPLSLFRELLPWNDPHSSPYGYLLLLPIGMAVVFLVILSAWGILLFLLPFAAVIAILLSVGVFVFLLFSVSAVAGTAVVSVWTGTLWAVWMSARVGLAAINVLVSAMVSSVSRASTAFDR